MASEILTAIDADVNSNGQEVADKYYDKYISILYSVGIRRLGKDYVMTKDDLEFINLNFEYFNLKKRAYLFAPPPKGGFGEETAELDAGTIAYFNNKPEYDFTERMVFIKYGGAWLQYIIPNKEWNSDSQKNIKNVMQKVYFEFESKEGSIFKEARNGYKPFSYVNFKKDLSKEINSWLRSTPSGPLIKGLKVIKESPNGPFVFFVNENQDLGTNINDNKTVSNKPLTKDQKDVLIENGFYNPKAPFIKYAPGQENTVEVSEDLSQIKTVKGQEAGYFQGERQNILARVYFEIVATELLRQHYIILNQQSSEAASLSNVRNEYEFAVNASVNRENKVIPRAFVENSQGMIGYRIAQDLLNSIRRSAILLFLKQDPSEQTKSSLDKAFKKAEDAVKNNEEITGKDIDLEDLSDEDIAAKQKFLKQCLLMSRLKDISKMNIDAMTSKQGIHEEIPYKGRLYYVRDQKQDSCSVINKLLIPNIKSIGAFKNITPAEHASLVPKIRLVKIFTEDGKLKEHEFKFPKKTDTNRVNNLFSTDFDKGSDFGVKEFSFSFDGTTPATAKNDITANLKLYFQSFDDFIKKHPRNNGHRYVDLLILPSKDNVNKKGSGATSPLQFDTSYYRIRVDVGWESSSAPNETIRKAIQKINKTFYLNMVDHEINIRDDGSVDINVSYRAYIESTLKGTTLDALASRESRQALESIRKEYRDVVNKAACTNEQLSRIRSQFLQIEENLRRNAFQSIIKRLVDNNLMKHVVAEGTAANSFARTGFLSSPAIFTSDKTKDNSAKELAEKSDSKNFTLQQNLFRDVTLSNSKDNLLINYFYLGDLLYVILDCLYIAERDDKKINETYVKDTENFKFILSSFDFIDIFNNSSTETVNIGNIPISVELFNEWFTENVIKPERNSYPVMYFIRDITKFLIGEILLETCFKNDLDKRLQFKTSNFLGKKNSNSTTDPIGDLLSNSNKAVLDVNTYYQKGDLPLQADIDGVSTPMKDLFNYIMIYVDSARIKTDKVGNKFDDENNGVMHYQLGKDRGILKKIKFTKSDMQYIREARFFRHGHDGLMQLSAVYKISMDMVGNTLYYPGMEVFIDPVGLIGAGSDFDPRIRQSIANKLGFGGYHLVTRVKSTIGPGKFTTNVEALFDYSGDGDPKSRVIGSKEEIKISAIDDDKISDRPQGAVSQKYCQAVSDDLNKTNIELGYGFNQEYSGLDDKTQELANEAYVEITIQRDKRAETTAEEIMNLVNEDVARDEEALIRNRTESFVEEESDTDFGDGTFFEAATGRTYMLTDTGEKEYLD